MIFGVYCIAIISNNNNQMANDQCFKIFSILVKISLRTFCENMHADLNILYVLFDVEG